MISLNSIKRFNAAVLVDRSVKVVRPLLPGLAVIHLQLTDPHLLAGTWGKGLRRLPLAEIRP